MRRRLVVCDSPDRPAAAGNAVLAHIWRELSRQNWGGGPCPDADRERWIWDISVMTGATGERVEHIGQDLGLISAGITGWEWQERQQVRGEEADEGWLPISRVATLLGRCHRSTVPYLRKQGVALLRDERGHWRARRAEVEALVGPTRSGELS